MTALEFVAANPVTAAGLLAVVLLLAPRFITAPLRLFIVWRKPGDCPRCNGTGREPLK